MRSALAASLVILLACATAGAQPPLRRAVTVEAVRAYPGFFHGQAVALLGTVTRHGTDLTLADEGGSLRLVGHDMPGEGQAEVRGVVYDIGRMNNDDPRLLALDLGRAFTDAYAERWPRPGEEVVLQVTGSEPPPAAASAATPPMRAVALEPRRYVDQTVTLLGQFRGRNLYADVPEAPTSERWDFVIRAGDAAVWVTGLRPRGKGFTFDPSRRVDTGQWIRVSGTMHYARGLVWMDGTTIVLADAPTEDAAVVSVPPPPPPPLEILFSAPTAGEVDVQPDATIRLQFSRDVDPASLEDRVRIRAGDGDGGAQAADIPVTFEYTPATRSLEIRPAGPLPAFQAMTLELLDGIQGPDGARLEPFTLTFTTSG